MTSVLTEIISLLTGGISGIATGIGEGLTSLVTKIFLTGTGTSADPYALSVFGGVIVIFAGVALAIGLSKLIVNWVSGLGGGNV